MNQGVQIIASMSHVCFSEAGCGMVKQALKVLGRREEVPRFYDDLSIGPVADVCGEDRHRWMLNYFGPEFEIGWQQQVGFWNNVHSWGNGQITVWTTRRSTLEYACFLEFLTHLLAGTRFALIDLTDYVLDGSGGTDKPRRVRNTGESTVQQGLAAFNFVQIVSKDLFQKEMQLWARLKRENAPLRSFVGGHLMSVPEDHYDGDILSFMTTTWRKAARVIGDCLWLMPDHEEYALVGDFWLWRRIEAMAAAGTIDFKGGADMRHTEVRLKSR